MKIIFTRINSNGVEIFIDRVPLESESNSRCYRLGLTALTERSILSRSLEFHCIITRSSFSTSRSRADLEEEVQLGFMSVNQSRPERNQGQLRKPTRLGSSGQQRGFVGGSGKGGGGGSGPSHLPISTFTSHAAAPPSSVASSLPTNRSFKKSGNGHGGQSRMNHENTSSEADAVVPNTTTVHRVVQNGPQALVPSPGYSDTPVPEGAKSVGMSTPRNAPRAIPKAPTSQSSTGSSGSQTKSIQPKGDTSRAVTLQFGTINPGIVNGLQIPARTSSAPPNLDEQKRDQARAESFRPVPVLPIPPVPKQQYQQQTRKDVGIAHQSSSMESRPVNQIKRDVTTPVASASVVAPPKSSVLPLSGMPMPMTIPFQPQQPQVPPQFGGPSPQMQSPGLLANSLQLPMTMNAAQVAPPIFVPGVQPHFVQQQAMMHQGQGLGYAPAIGHQYPQQLGNLGLGITPQFPQQQPNKPVGPRKTTVKITHPETHEELRLDKRTDSYRDGVSSGQRPLPNVIPQSQPIPTYTAAQQMNYYSSLQQTSYNSSPIIFPTSVPLTSGHVPASSQATRYSYPVGQSGQLSFINSSMVNTIPGSKPMPLAPLRGISEGINLDGVPSSTSVLAPGQITARQSISSQGEKAGASPWTPSVVISMPSSKAEAPKPLKTVADATAPYQRHNETSPDGSDQKLKSGSEQLVSVLPVTDTSSSAPAPVLSTLSEALSAPETQAGDSELLLSVNVDKERESVQRSDYLKDQKKQSKKDLTNMEEQPQLDGATSMGARSSLLSTTKDCYVEKKTIHEGCTKVEDRVTLSISDMPTSSTCPSHKDENKIVSEIGPTESIENKEIATASGSSRLEKQTYQDASLSYADSFGLPPDGVSSKAYVPSVATTLGITVNGTNIDNLATNISAVNTVLDVRRTEMLDYSEKSEASNSSSQDSDGVKVHSSSTTAKCSANSVMQVKQDDEKVKISEYEVDNKLFSHSIEDIDSKENNRTDKEQNTQIGTSVDSTDSVTTLDCDIPSANDDKDRLDTAVTKCELKCSKDVGLTNSRLASKSASIHTQPASSRAHNLDDGVVSATSLGQKEKPSKEIMKPKITTGKKKQRKEMFSKADAAGSSDLYNAYKGPDEKPEDVSNSETVDRSTEDTKTAHVDYPDTDVTAIKEDGQNKAELDSWENVADISTPKLKKSEHVRSADGARKQDDDGEFEITSRKKYSRDFLLTLSQRYIELPVGFQIGSDIQDALMSSPLARSPGPSPGRNVDRQSSGRRMVGNLDEDKWTRAPGSFGPVHDVRLDAGHGPANINLRLVQGGSQGVLKGARAQGGLLSGPMPSQGVMLRGGPDERWKRARGLIPSPQTPMQVMHKAEKKYEVGKITDEEQAKQRQLKAILNKLTPQNFDKLFAQVREVNIDNADTLTRVISQIFDKALMEPTFCEMYANFCFHLADVLPDFNEDNERITFKRLLLNKCQEEFERGERDEAEANKVEEEGEIKQSAEEREEKRLRARRRMLGNIRLIGELYKKKMLTERIMHECIKKLLGQYQNPDEENIESLCKLMSTIGEMIDHPKAKEHMDAYFDMMTKLSTNQKLSSRVRFMLRDSIDLRKNKWQQRRKVEGPKKIDEVHRDAAQERHAQSSRLGRGPVITNIPRRGQAVDYGSRGSTPLSSPNSQQFGGARGVPPQARGYRNQDVRLEDRHRTMTVPLPQRSPDDDYITLGPQGGLARGMSGRGHPSISNISAAEASPVIGDQRRMSTAPNGISCIADRVSGFTHDQLSPRDCNSQLGSREKNSDRSYERSTSILPAGQTQDVSGGSLTAVSEPKTFPDEVLQEKSISAIREFYSAKDENEVVLCVKELNAPIYFPSIISLWVTDSFERKDMERDLLSKLIVNLCKSRDNLLSQVQLLQGFEYVLSSLEDSVNDAPRAAEFLGRIFAKVVVEDLISLSDIGRLLHEGGDEPGRLREIGLAAEVLGNILETIRSERGVTVLNEIRASSNLRLEDFRSPHSMKSKLEAFL
ncbi:eukaryotic translation initiation factor 4G-like [Canna indica]|uniref:Eukaryotic translation initiation factor 4G n=1 Tax=Canna indica TaxID=4628 RepID=A0AAQ3KLZ7_9LILI|nr:eukaryotic translation initiation factor 4G-like [Canna indica]